MAVIDYNHPAKPKVELYIIVIDYNTENNRVQALEKLCNRLYISCSLKHPNN